MKIVTAFNRNLDLELGMNAVQHSLVGLAAQEHRSFCLRNFDDSKQRRLATLTDFPLIVMVARNSEHIRNAYHKAQAADILCNCFVTRFFDGSPDEQERDILAADLSEDEEFAAIALLGSDTDLRPITKKMSVYSP